MPKDDLPLTVLQIDNFWFMWRSACFQIPVSASCGIDFGNTKVIEPSKPHKTKFILLFGRMLDQIMFLLTIGDCDCDGESTQIAALDVFLLTSGYVLGTQGAVSRQ